MRQFGMPLPPSGDFGAAYYIGVFGSACCAGLFDVLIMAGLGAVGGLLWWQMTGQSGNGDLEQHRHYIIVVELSIAENRLTPSALDLKAVFHGKAELRWLLTKTCNSMRWITPERLANPIACAM